MFSQISFDKCIRNLRSTGANLEEIDIIYHLLLTMLLYISFQSLSSPLGNSFVRGACSAPQ